MKATLLVCAALLLTITVFAQNPPTINAQPNTVFVSADGKYEAAPDTAMVQFTIAAQESAAKDAYAKASQQTDQLRQILRTNGVDPKSAEIGYFSLQPVYEYKNPKRKLIGYRGNSNVTLKLKDFTKVGPILQGLADLDVTENQQISYILDNIEEGKVKASQDALGRAKQQAAAVAQAGGRALGEMVYVSVDTFEPPRPMPMAYAKAGVAAMAEQAPPTAEFLAQKITGYRSC